MQNRRAGYFKLQVPPAGLKFTAPTRKRWLLLTTLVFAAAFITFLVLYVTKPGSSSTTITTIPTGFNLSAHDPASFEYYQEAIAAKATSCSYNPGCNMSSPSHTCQHDAGNNGCYNTGNNKCIMTNSHTIQYVNPWIFCMPTNDQTRHGLCYCLTSENILPTSCTSDTYCHNTLSAVCAGNEESFIPSQTGMCYGTGECKSGICSF